MKKILQIILGCGISCFTLSSLVMTGITIYYVKHNKDISVPSISQSDDTIEYSMCMVNDLDFFYINLVTGGDEHNYGEYSSIPTVNNSLENYQIRKDTINYTVKCGYVYRYVRTSVFVTKILNNQPSPESDYVILHIGVFVRLNFPGDDSGYGGETENYYFPAG